MVFAGGHGAQKGDYFIASIVAGQGEAVVVVAVVKVERVSAVYNICSGIVKKLSWRTGVGYCKLALILYVPPIRYLRS